MNASRRHKKDHLAYICLGSNISPEENLRKAIEMLREHTCVLQISSCWETKAFNKSAADGSQWPNFINAAALLSTPLNPAALKEQVLSPIEIRLGRVRTENKYVPRTIDLDIILYDDQVLDNDLWQRVYLALIFAEMLPDLRNPYAGECLRETAKRLQLSNFALRREDIRLD